MNTPAFPTGFITDDKGVVVGGSNGMTLRDYFAAKAMQGVIAATPAQIQIDETHLAKWSYKMADAMLKARKVNND